MKSPRFDIRAKTLQRIFSSYNIERVWKKKIRQSLRDQFTKDGVENFDFHISYQSECRKISQIVLSGEYTPSKPRRILLEKSKGLCRQIVIPSVQDAIVLQCLSDALYDEIKGKAPTNNAFFEPKDHNFSDSERGYGTFASWLNFQKELFRFSKNRKYVVVTDIANYYDSISYVHLRNAISSISGVEECILDMLIFVLSDLLWQPDYTPRIEVGLPQINLDAPRLLAHCFLYELDAFLASELGGDFVRYMDDIDVGVDTIVEAKNTLKSIDLVLQTKQVRLNSGKTMILNQLGAIRHFRILENARLDAVKASVSYRKKHALPLDRQRRLVELRVRQGIKTNQFDTGNGEKVLKRWLNLAAQTNAKIKPETIASLIRTRPSVRDAVYNFIRAQPLTPSIAKALAGAASSGFLVDDAGILEMANSLVETLVKTRSSKKHITAIIQSCDQSKNYGLYAKLWLQSKYSEPEEILKSLIETEKIWVPDEHLGRLAGSLYPLFISSAVESDFKHLLNGTLNPGVRETYKFHLKLMNDEGVFRRMYSALKRPNTSRATGITHAKFICLMSALRCAGAPKGEVTTIRLNNNAAFDDIYYRTIAKRLKVF